jgi:hypothetical protein
MHLFSRLHALYTPSLGPLPSLRLNTLLRRTAFVLICMVTWPAAAVWAQQSGNASAALRATADEAGSSNSISWQDLTPTQRLALRPLQPRWGALPPDRQQKWLDVAARFGRLPARDQARVHERMASWSRLTPEEHGQARLNFQEAKQLPSEDRQDKWEAYQSLSDDEKRVLAKRHRDQIQAPARAGRLARRQNSQDNDDVRTTHKSNLTPNPAYAPARQPVGTALLRAAPGATTSLISSRPKPPLHQQTGLPKIQSSSEFVDPRTLLPQRGPQGAAVVRSATPSVQKTQR